MVPTLNFQRLKDKDMLAEGGEKAISEDKGSRNF